jgi:hypothetical protein
VYSVYLSYPTFPIHRGDESYADAFFLSEDPVFQDDKEEE